MTRSERDREQIVGGLQRELEVRPEVVLALLHGSFSKGGGAYLVLNDAPLAFRYHALQGRPLVVRDERFLDELRARTWDDYLDFQPFARQYLREALSE